MSGPCDGARPYRQVVLSQAQLDSGLLKLACALLWFRRYHRLGQMEGGSLGGRHA